MEAMTADERGSWSEQVEDLVESGDLDAAIAFLETLTSKLQTSTSESQLASALFELANLYASKGLSLKADDARSRATVLKNRTLHAPSSPPAAGELETSEKKAEKFKVSADVDHLARNGEGNSEQLVDSIRDAPQEASSDEDWEAIAERAPDELLAPQSLTGVSNLSLDDPQETVSKRRGRGHFSYRKHGLYSDHQSEDLFIYDPQEKAIQDDIRGNSNIKNSYGSRHALLLSGFPPSTTTRDLEKLLEKFQDHGSAIRWVNDTVALAVFRTPSLALGASKSIRCPFSVRLLEEDDIMFYSIAAKDLEPPRQRPKTSARTAQRLIAQSMGLKMPSTFGSSELRNQEEARRNRIVARQNLKDDAWGPDDEK